MWLNYIVYFFTIRYNIIVEEEINMYNINKKEKNYEK